MHATLSGVAFFVDGTSFYVPVGQDRIDKNTLKETLGTWFASDQPKVSAQCKYARHALANTGIELNRSTEDVTLLSYVIEAHMKHELSNLALRWLKEDVPALEDLIGKGAIRRLKLRRRLDSVRLARKLLVIYLNICVPESMLMRD